VLFNDAVLAKTISVGDEYMNT